MESQLLIQKLSEQDNPYAIVASWVGGSGNLTYYNVGSLSLFALKLFRYASTAYLDGNAVVASLFVALCIVWFHEVGD